MCLAVPGRISQIVGRMARTDFCGVERTILIDLLPDLEPGEYVLIHAGFAIQRLEPSEAAEFFTQMNEAEAAIEAGQRKRQ
jgi:hydrogenase expression/formation protein HypC